MLLTASERAARRVEASRHTRQLLQRAPSRMRCGAELITNNTVLTNNTLTTVSNSRRGVTRLAASEALCAAAGSASERSEDQDVLHPGDAHRVLAPEDDLPEHYAVLRPLRPLRCNLSFAPRTRAPLLRPPRGRTLCRRNAPLGGCACEHRQPAGPLLGKRDETCPVSTE